MRLKLPLDVRSGLPLDLRLNVRFGPPLVLPQFRCPSVNSQARRARQSVVIYGCASNTGGGEVDRAGSAERHARNDFLNSSTASVSALAISSESAPDAASSVSTFGRSDSRNR